MQKIPAAKFKAQCLALMDQASQSGQPVIITKRGKPVVKLVPMEMDGKDIFGFMAGKARIVGDIETSAPLSDWNLGRSCWIPTSWRFARLQSRLASAINIWELAWLAENGRIETTMSIESFLWKCVSKVNLLPVRPEIAVRAVSFP